jgi:hypothetical protein
MTPPPPCAKPNPLGPNVLPWQGLQYAEPSWSTSFDPEASRSEGSRLSTVHKFVTRGALKAALVVLPPRPHGALHEINSFVTFNTFRRARKLFDPPSLRRSLVGSEASKGRSPCPFTGGLWRPGV